MLVLYSAGINPDNLSALGDHRLLCDSADILQVKAVRFMIKLFSPDIPLLRLIRKFLGFQIMF